jgi:protein-tyrosine kinase
MEPLQEAIEKARQQRDGEIGQTGEPGDTRARQTGAQQAPAAPEASQAEQAADKPTMPLPSQVRYSSTRQVDPQESILSHNRVIAGDIGDPRVEAYRQLRSQVLGIMKRNNWHTLAITSAHENAGKTLTAVNLAISISQEVSQTVMLVDLDLRKPNVHTTLGIDIDKGIVDHLQFGEPIENILLNPGYPRLVLLPGVAQGRQSSEMLSSPEMAAFLKDITQRYADRIIIFDLPPLLRNDDAMVFVPNADACLLVVEDGVTRPDDIERSVQLLKHSQLIGTILNKAR